MKQVNAAIPKKYAEAIDDFVKSGEYASRNEFVREAVRDKLIARGMLKAMSLKETDEVAIHG